MATQRSRRPAGDYTGRRSEQLAREAAAQNREGQGAISTTNGPLGGEGIVVDEGVLVDLTIPTQPKHVRVTDEDLSTDDRQELERETGLGREVIVAEGIQVEERTRLMRVAEECHPTIGFGPFGPNDYHFVPGQLYKVPAIVYDHLDEIGYVYH